MHNLGAFLDVATVLYPQLQNMLYPQLQNMLYPQLQNMLYTQVQNIDFRKTVTRFDVPVYFVQGRYAIGGRAEPFAQWFKMLDAPSKHLIVFDTSGHRPLFEQPVQFHEFMVNTVLAENPTSP